MIHFTPLFFVYAAVVTISVVMAAFVVREERAGAVVCASVLMASWMTHLSSWTHYSPEQMLTGAHDLATHASAWAVMNTIAALVTLVVARYTLWGPVLFGFLFSGCLNDTMLWLEVYDWLTFGRIADVLFLGEQAIFFTIGGSGLAAFVSRHTRVRGNVFRSRRTAQKAAVTSVG